MTPMRQKVLEVTQKATASGSLKRITAGHQLLEGDHGIKFILFHAQQKNQKPQPLVQQESDQDQATKKKEFRDPFAKEHLEPDLFIDQIHGTHNLVLNKFLVVDEHLVLPTIEFEEQEKPLTLSDFKAAWTCMNELDGVVFFNCGYESGASQPHKHMQLIGYSTMRNYTDTAMESRRHILPIPSIKTADSILCLSLQPPLLQFIHERLEHHPQEELFHLPELPFYHFLHRIDLSKTTKSATAAARVHEIYQKVLAAMNATTYPLETTSKKERHPLLPVAYNLLLTESFLFMIPRSKQSSPNGMEVNSIGFMGSFLVRNDEQLAFFQREGPMKLLSSLCFPSSLASSL